MSEGSRAVAILGVILLLSLQALFVATGNAHVALDPRILFWYDLPVLLVTAFLYDYNPNRRSLYFWGGSSAVAVSLIILLWK